MLRFLAIGALLVGACGDDGPMPPPDAGTDASPPPCDGVPTFEPGTASGHAEPLGASTEEARAGILTAGMLPPDPDGLSLVEAGDIVLANDRVAFLIEAAGDSDLLDPWGGKLVGIASVEGGALVAPADWNEGFPLLGRFGIAADTVTIVDDGSGGAAVARASGPLVAVPFFAALAEPILPEDLSDLEASLEYVLEPDAAWMDVFVTIRSVRTRETRLRLPLHFFFQARRMPTWTPTGGFTVGAEANDFVTFVEDGATSFAWSQPGFALETFIELSGGSIYLGEPITFGACDQTRTHYARVHAGRPGLDGLLRVVRESEGTAERLISGTVTDDAGTPVQGVRVHATDDGGRHLSRVTTDEAGGYEMAVPADATVELWAYRRGDELVGPVAAPGGTIDLQLAPAGAIHVVATEIPGDAPLPVRVQVVPTGELPLAPDRFGEPPEVEGRLHVVFPIDGDVTLRVPVGRHRVVISRGFEYEIHDEEVDVAAGETVDLVAPLQRVVDTIGVMCGDFHIHTHRSFDTADPVLLKLASAAGDGVEIPVRSDHEWVGDFEPAITQLGLETHLFGVGSLELTTFAWGHFGIFPLVADPAAVNDGALRWYDRATPDVLAEARARASQPAVIVNHPRTFGGLMNEGAYFASVGYDPTTGMVERPTNWDEEFRLMEAFNDSDFDANVDETVRDWFSFLNAGRPMFVVGSSDSHQIVETPVGYPRTCLAVGVDDAASLRALGSATVRDTLYDGHATVSGGIFVDAVAGTAGPGDTVSGASDRETVSVTVRAATWVDVDSLRVYVDGTLTETFPIDASTVDPLDATVRLRADVEVPVAAGPLSSWAVFVAAGDQDLSPVHPGRRPFAVTNPIFFAR